jgi:hypothetical protein
LRRNSHGRYCLLQHSATYVDCIVVNCGGRSVEAARTVRWHGFKLITHHDVMLLRVQRFGWLHGKLETQFSWPLLLTAA